ncbi:MAG: hypothetical protein ACOYBC_03925 [Bilifractor sp.]|jgi:hypothetical protein
MFAVCILLLTGAGTLYAILGLRLIRKFDEYLKHYYYHEEE